MNYYENHIGDYEKSTSHLTACEDGIYGRLLRRYYDTEAPLPPALPVVQRLVRARTKDEKTAVQAMLLEFFTLADDGWHQVRCDKEIEKFREKSAKAKRSAEARWNSQCERNANASETHNGRNALQTPVTSNQKEQKQQQGGKPPMELPDWLPADAWQDWHDYRNRNKGWTHKARELSLRTLTQLWATGHDPRGVIHQSIERGWTGLFPVKAGAGPPQSAAPSKTLSAIQRLEDMKNGQLAGTRTADRLPEIALLGAGSDSGD